MRFGFALLGLTVPTPLLAQTVCDEGAGALTSVQPLGTTPQDVIAQFAAKESVFRQAWNNYTYTEEVIIQTLNGDTVSGEYREAADIAYDNNGVRVRKPVALGLHNALPAVVSAQDLEYIRDHPSFELTTESLPYYSISYAGAQNLDGLDTYVFDVTPTKLDASASRFQGRVWVDNQDLQIIRTCGRVVPDTTNATGTEPFRPTFETNREQIDAVYWFPTYVAAEGHARIDGNDVRIREHATYRSYKRR